MGREPISNVWFGIPTGVGSFHALVIFGSGIRRLANACGYIPDTRTRFGRWLGIATSDTFFRRLMTARCGFGIPKRQAAFKSSKDMRSALSTPLGTSIGNRSFRATPAVDSVRSQFTQHPIPGQFEPDSSKVAQCLPLQIARPTALRAAVHGISLG